MLKVFKDFFACKDVFAANLQNPENIQRLFCLQICLRRKSSLSWKHSKAFSPAKLSSTQIIIILKIFKIFSPAKLSWQQIIIMLKVFKDFFACKDVFAANLQNPENIQRLFCLQICLRRKSSLSWNYSNIFPPAKVSSTQITIILKIFNDFSACKIVLAANHHYPEKIQRLFWLQICLSCKSSLSWKHSKTFSPAKLS